MSQPDIKQLENNACCNGIVTMVFQTMWQKCSLSFVTRDAPIRQWPPADNRRLTIGRILSADTN